MRGLLEDLRQQIENSSKRGDQALLPYLSKILSAFPHPGRPLVQPARPDQTGQGLVEPLSERELEVLALLCQGDTNKEISEKLVVTLNTVKKHNNRIFGKLGVTSRVQAVLLARRLGLFPGDGCSSRE
jgi:LuxR family maltose regulon positive regulatory protein